MNDLIEALARQAATAQRVLAEAAQNHATATGKVEHIAERIADVAQRRAAITQARLGGTSTPDEAIELSALGEDSEALQRMAAAAEAEAAALLPPLEMARAALARAEDEWQHHQDEAQYNALLARAREHEAALLKVVADTYAAGQLLGHKYLRQSWRPSAELSSAMSTGSL